MKSKNKLPDYITTELDESGSIQFDDGGKPRVRPPVAKISPNDPKPPGPPAKKSRDSG